jgi:hypothetical protein
MSTKVRRGRDARRNVAIKYNCEGENMATKLEQVQRFDWRAGGGYYPLSSLEKHDAGDWITYDEALSAATIDNREAYARGVEDGKNRAYASAAGYLVSLANVERLPGAVGMSLYALADVFEARASRATEELQRLEAMKNGK